MKKIYIQTYKKKIDKELIHKNKIGIIKSKIKGENKKMHKSVPQYLIKFLQSSSTVTIEFIKYIQKAFRTNKLNSRIECQNVI